jgi:hypothetical protein
LSGLIPPEATPIPAAPTPGNWSRILQCARHSDGERQAPDLPVQATKADLIINLKTGAGINFPLTLLGLADEVNE